MCSLGVALAISIIACGFPRPANVEPDAAVVDAAGDIVMPNCMSDEFDGAALDAHWATLAGALPTYNIEASRLLISDAPFADTSTPDRSWIDKLDVDKGNQIAWSFAIGGGDFVLDADVAWSSTIAEYTLGAVGVSDAQGHIAAMAGLHDGNNTKIGNAFGKLHVVGGPDVAHDEPQTREAGAAQVQIQRTGGVASISINGTQQVSGSLPDLISNVVIIYVRFKNSTMLSEFGTFEVRRIRICLP